MKLDYMKIKYRILDKLFDKKRNNEINLNNIETLFDYKNLKAELDLLDENTNRFNEIIYNEFIKPNLKRLDININEIEN